MQAAETVNFFLVFATDLVLVVGRGLVGLFELRAVRLGVFIRGLEHTMRGWTIVKECVMLMGC